MMVIIDDDAHNGHANDGGSHNVDAHDNGALYDDDAHNNDAHGLYDVPGEHGPRWNPQLGRFAKWSSGQLAHTVVSVTFQWTEVSSPKSCHLGRHDNLNHRSRSSQSSMAVIHEEQIQMPDEPKIDGPVKTYYPPPLETITQNLILL